MGDGTSSGTAATCQASTCGTTATSRACTCDAQACTGEQLLYSLGDLAAQLDGGTPALTWTVGGPAVNPGVTVAALLQTNQPLAQEPTWNVAQRTGFTEPGVVTRGTSTSAEGSAVQLGTHGVGLFLNTCSPGTSARDVIQPLTLSQDFATDVRPFAAPATWPELAFRFQAVAPTLTQKGAAVAYAAAVLRFRDKSRPVPAGQPAWFYDVWVSMQLIDSRGTPQPEGVIMDSCATCSGLPIVITAPSGLASPPKYMHTTQGSTGSFSGATTFNSWRDFDLRVSTDEFQRLLLAISAASPRGLSTNPADYALVHWNLNPEVYDPSPATTSCVPATDADWGTLGMAVRAVQLAQVPWVNLPRIEYTGANAGTGNVAQVFFGRTTDPAFNEPKSFQALLPASGAHALVRFNTLANPEWRDGITRLRLDPMNGTGNFAVDSLVVFGANNVELFRDEFNSDPNAPGNPWQSHDVSAWALEQNGTTWDGLAGGTGDPSLWRAVPSLPTGR
jgi:hypothetical protein